MNIVLVNQDWFAPELRALGHRVLSVGTARHLDIRLPVPFLDLHSFIAALPEEERPDRIVVLDNSAPVIVHGLVETPIPTLFYGVDTHHHLELHRLLYHGFDAMFIAHRDYLVNFHERGLHPTWLPLWATRLIEPSVEKTHGAVFVGVLDAKLNPDRLQFFNALREHVPVLCTQGEFWNIFPYAEMVINQTVKGDLNFRVFEAMMSGAMLLTEASGNGLSDLFAPDLHLVTYPKNDVAAAAEKIKYYLAHPEECRRIGTAGRAAIMAGHLPMHRAQVLHEQLVALKKREDPYRAFSFLANFCALARRLEQLQSNLAGNMFGIALHYGRLALQRHERVNDEFAMYVIHAGLKFDRIHQSDEGLRLIDGVSEANPESIVLGLARIQARVMRGQTDVAQGLASTLFTTPLNEVMHNAAHVAESILEQ